GAFEKIRGRYPNSSATEEYNTWLEQQGFNPVTKFTTNFGFKTKQEAKYVIGSIWGKRASSRVKNKNLNHNIVIYHKKK
ncbi:MAG: hypothetical protein HN366_29520, partial [Deltaproteobacteria bacterium]|nr:hypothetical protein [Deltaproteobacteria bacterium]